MDRCRRLPQLVCWIVAVWSAPVAAEPPLSPDVMMDDAELCDVFFVDQNQGWAVGDRGVIWHTDDGGRNWARQRSPVACRLKSVFFLNEKQGWAVGGWMQPYSMTSRCVVLRTLDGGKRWVRTPMLMLPALEHVVFFNEQTGCAVGDSSTLYPSGVYRTFDGGRSWSTVPGGSFSRLMTGDFARPNRGVVAGRDGRLQLFNGSELVATRTPNLGQRALRKLVLNGNGGWLVGDGGLIFNTADGGLSWQAPETTPPIGVVSQFDFAALAVRGDNCWIAGNPGSVVMHSPDGGRHWESFRTNWPLPIHSLHFTDSRNGWAVGALGAILHSRDGGRRWSVQRRGGTRLAMLGLLTEPARLPVELISQVAGEDGYLVHAEVAFRRPDERAAAIDRTHYATVRAGGSGGRESWRFPIRHDERLRFDQASLVTLLGEANDGLGVRELEAHLVRRLRQWRPDVVLVEGGKQPLAVLLRQTLMTASEKAADPTSYSGQLTAAGLTVWRVKRIVQLLDDSGGKPDCAFSTMRIAPQLGGSVADYAAHARGLISAGFEAPPASVGVDVLANHVSTNVSSQDLFRGLNLSYGGEARRRKGTPMVHNLESLKSRIQKHRNVRQLLRRSQSGNGESAAMLGQVGELTAGMNAAAASQVIRQLATVYQQQGQNELAADALRHLVTRFPESDSVESAMTWLVQYYASGEAGVRLRRQSQIETRNVEALPESRVVQATATSPAQVGTTVRQGGGKLTAAVQTSVASRAKHAVSLGQLAQRTRPELHSHPSVRIPLAVAERRMGIAAESQRYINSLAGKNSLPEWRKCAQGELWVAHKNGRPPKPVAVCAMAAEKPLLDGKLDDRVWQAAKPVELGASMRKVQSPASVLLAYDNDYLYLGAHCAKQPGLDYPKASARRQRDTNLEEHDRVELLIDIDRDYATYFRFTVDHRGWAADSCLGDATWDPRWFIKASEDSTSWTVEAAIPLEEISGGRARGVWAIGLQRIVPNAGLQSWTTPAAVKARPEGFGLLLFQGQ